MTHSTLIPLTYILFSPTPRPQRESSPTSLRNIDHLQNCIPTSLIWGRFMKVRRHNRIVWSSTNIITEFHYSFYHWADHRWTFHPERLQPADYDNSPMSHLTELQSVSPQQLMPPYRYSSDSLALHLDPPLAPLPVAPQVRKLHLTAILKPNYCQKSKMTHSNCLLLYPPVKQDGINWKYCQLMFC